MYIAVLCEFVLNYFKNTEMLTINCECPFFATENLNGKLAFKFIPYLDLEFRLLNNRPGKKRKNKTSNEIFNEQFIPLLNCGAVVI